ncbi:MAG: TetR/AcrR family transcriptional regulator [Chloroflexi bacterium]|nr:TetR/AcrR family transcriptional regulator [Chloroflexota bacterium]
MSPTPARTSRDAIIAAARSLLEEEGLDAVTMASVADRVGVRPPSLYKHVRDRGALIAAVSDAAALELGLVLEAAVRSVPDEGTDDGAHARILRAALAFRALASRSPRSVSLVFAGLGGDLQPSVETAAIAARPLLEISAELAGQDRALVTARALTAFAYGFCAMEQGQAFRFGGDVDEAFSAGIEALIRGLAQPGSVRSE